MQGVEGIVAKESPTLRNWASTHSVTPTKLYEPYSLDAIISIVNFARNEDAAGGRHTIRVIGAGHSPNACAMNTDLMVSLRHYSRITVDREKRTVSAQGGATLASINEALGRAGLAFDNLGSISDQTVAGAFCTGTHGSAATKRILGDCITRLTLVLANGKLLTCSRTESPHIFRAAVCSLGALGIIVEVVMRAVPAFDLRARERVLSLADAISGAAQRSATSEYYRLWWFPNTDRVLEWSAEKAPASAPSMRPASLGLLSSVRWLLTNRIFGYYLLEAALFVSVFLPFCAPWITRLWFAALFDGPPRESTRPSVSQFNFDCLFQQRVAEWSIPLEELPRAMDRLRSLIESGSVVAHFPIEIRFVKEDDFWLSPACSQVEVGGQDEGGDAPTSGCSSSSSSSDSSSSSSRVFAFIGVIMYRPFGFDVYDGVPPLFSSFEELMTSELSGRPHWGKHFNLRGRAGFGARYPHWDEFCALRAQLDPGGMWVNPWLDRVLGLNGKFH